jgi:hypothetical protein
MRLWLGGPPFEEAALDEGAAWAADGPALEVDAWLSSLAAGRDEQRALLNRLDAGAWTAAQATVWGDMPLRWVVAKTYQHTAEHTSDILRIALYWDFFVEEASGTPT